LALTTAITIAGNITYDPELRQTGQGKPVVNITVAVNPRFYDNEAKEWKDGEAVFWKCSAFQNVAEHIAHSLRKGDRVIVYGTVKPNTWTDKNSGVQKTENIIMIDEIGMSLAWTNVQAVKSAPARGQAADSGEGGWVTSGEETPW
jgi:single-strand DNA-binding protein